jgi:hypothetical protein
MIDMILKDRRLTNILDLMSSRYDSPAKFNHVLDEISKHPHKIARLKANEDYPGHLNEEIADIYLLSCLLVELGEVKEEEVERALDHFLGKIEEIYS